MTSKKSNLIPLLDLALNIGFMIAIPLVLLAFLGVLIDKWLNSSPLFTIISILISIIITTIIIYRKIMQEMVKLNNADDNKDNKTDIGTKK